MSPKVMSGKAASGTRERILDATRELAAGTGMRKLSMDEVARRAGVSRAGLYKHFAGRDALISALVEEELATFFAGVQAVAQGYDDDADRLVHSFAAAYRSLSEHPAIRPVLTMNPELFLPYVITADSQALNWGRMFVATFLPLDGWSTPDAANRFAEHVARAFHTLILIPSEVLGLDRPDGPEEYARDFLLPVLEHLRPEVDSKSE
ncbi:TetR/AcrR family transcriptional regulator [Nocardia sp. NPDC005978]|uniref:TetR/AcrR family transcriptional regulator n=1 Tax=Nocardia sp. NPDC005978 TaxID=3156725 RepID=UPI00339E951C